MMLRRTLAALLLVPHGTDLVARLSGERPDVLRAHRKLLREYGLRYVLDRQLFLNNNTDGPGNPWSNVYTREEARRLCRQFDEVGTAVRFLRLRTYPGGGRAARTVIAQRLGERCGWHL